MIVLMTRSLTLQNSQLRDPITLIPRVQGGARLASCVEHEGSRQEPSLRKTGPLAGPRAQGQGPVWSDLFQPSTANATTGRLRAIRPRAHRAKGRATHMYTGLDSSRRVCAGLAAHRRPPRRASRPSSSAAPWRTASARPSPCSRSSTAAATRRAWAGTPSSTRRTPGRRRPRPRA